MAASKLKMKESITVSDKQLRKRSVIAFSVFIVCMGLGIVGWIGLYRQPESLEDKAKPILRMGFETNTRLFSTFFSRTRETKTFSKDKAVKKVRVNGDAGMDGVLDTSWRLKVVRNPGDTILLTIDDLKALPRTEVVFDFKCVEGWSQVTWWAGVRFSDFMKKYNLAAQSGKKYVGLITPDGAYYVGNDMPSMLQPQTILCYEMNGAPLPQDQGFPLRLIIPVKYGIKHLKRIGIMYFSDERPKDYWAEQGYDYYSGL